ncbi:MAG: NHLP leader peptide family RiPP precursor [bacterium]
METPNQKKFLERKIIEKAMKDESFRSRLKSDPRGAIESEMGIKIPQSLKIEIMEEDRDTVYLILPARPVAVDNHELSEVELEAVAGGWTTSSECGSCNEYCEGGPP